MNWKQAIFSSSLQHSMRYRFDRMKGSLLRLMGCNTPRSANENRRTRFIRTRAVPHRGQTEYPSPECGKTGANINSDRSACKCKPKINVCQTIGRYQG